MYLFLWQECEGNEYLQTDKWCCLISFLLYHYTGNIFMGNKVRNMIFICCLILWDTWHCAYTLKQTSDEFILYRHTKCINQYLFLFHKWKNCMKMLIVYWLFYFHGTVLWYMSLDLGKMFIDHVISVHRHHLMFFSLCLWNCISYK